MSLFLPTFLLNGGAAPAASGDASTGDAGGGDAADGVVDTSVESAALEAEALVNGPDVDQRMADIMNNDKLDDDAKVAELLKLQLSEEEKAEQAKFEAQKKRPGFDATLARLKEKDPDAYNLMRSLRAQATRTSQESSAKVKEAESLLAALLGSDTAASLKKAAEAGSGDLDLWDPKSVEAAIEAKVAAKLQALLKPMEEARQLSAAQEAYTSWVETEAPEMANKPENAEFRQAVKTVMTEQDMGAKAAYAIVKLARVQGELKTSKANTAAIEEAVRKRGLKLSGGRSGVQPDLAADLVNSKEALSANDIYARLERAQNT